MAYSTRRTRRSQPLIAAFIAFGLFAVGYQFYETPEVVAEPVIPAPSAVSSVLTATTNGTWNFSALNFEFLPELPSNAPSFLPALAASLAITPAQLASLLLWQDTRLSPTAETTQTVFQAKIDEFAKSVAGTPSPTELKGVATALLASFALDPEKPHYNARSHNLAAVLRENSSAASSGTLVYELLALHWTKPGVNEVHRVQIFERGNILPGFITWKEGAWSLYGLEMTVRGAGLKNYGPVNSLGAQGLALRIVAVPEALIWNAVAPLTSNADAAAVTILRETARRFQIPLRQLEENIKAIAPKQSALSELPRTQIRSPWAFGQCFVPPADFVMIKRERIPSIDTHLPYPEILAARAVNRPPLSD